MSETATIDRMTIKILREALDRVIKDNKGMDENTPIMFMLGDPENEVQVRVVAIGSVPRIDDPETKDAFLELELTPNTGVRLP